MKIAAGCVLVVSLTITGCSSEDNWPQQIGSPTMDWPRAMASDPNGGFVIVGDTDEAVHDAFGEVVDPGNPTPFMSSYDARGVLRWTVGAEVTGHHLTRGLVVLDNSWVCHATAAESAYYSEAWRLDCFDPSGEVRWHRSFDTDWPVDGLLDAGGGVVEAIGDFDVLLGDASSTEIDAFAIRYDGSAEPSISARFGEPVDFHHGGHASEGAGSRYVWGYSSDPYFGIEPDDTQLVVVKVEANGEIAWTYAVGKGSSVHRALGHVSRDGGLVLAHELLLGENSGSGITVLRLNPQGGLVWSAVVETEPDSRIASVEVFDDHIYLGGSEGHYTELSSELNQNTFVAELSGDGQSRGRWVSEGHGVKGLKAEKDYIFVAGWVWGDYGPNVGQGYVDIFLDRLSRPLP